MSYAPTKITTRLAEHSTSLSLRTGLTLLVGQRGGGTTDYLQQIAIQPDASRLRLFSTAICDKIVLEDRQIREAVELAAVGEIVVLELICPPSIVAAIRRLQQAGLIPAQFQSFLKNIIIFDNSLGFLQTEIHKVEHGFDALRNHRPGTFVGC